MAAKMPKSCDKSSKEIFFEKHGVYIQLAGGMPDDKKEVQGKIKLFNSIEGVCVKWEPLDVDSGATLGNRRFAINFNIEDLKSFKRNDPIAKGWSYLIFILRCGTTCPTLNFYCGGTKDFITALEVHMIIKRSPVDPCLFLVREHNPQALSQSFDELKLFKDQESDMVTAFTYPSRSVFKNIFTDRREKRAQTFFRDPYSATLGGFSKVTNFLRDNLTLGELTAESSIDFLSDRGSMSPSLITTKDENGFEMVTRTELPSRCEVERAVPFNSKEWSQCMDKDGKVNDVDEIRMKIFRGGVDPSLRIEVWKFLLGCYEWNSTYASRTVEQKRKVDSYFRMKKQWESVSEEQTRRFALFRERKSLIDKDVFRTDRTHEFFCGSDNQNIQVLHDILMTYCMYNFDLGYIQGMSDLLSPILVVMANEVDAFWCFSGFMDLVCKNFEKSQEGMKYQLLDLENLVKFYDPQLYNYLESHDSSNMYFCFRWTLIIFKREFSFDDIMSLWEVVWSGKPCLNFHLLLCLAILENVKSTLMENNFGFTEILKHINDLTGSINLEILLKKAEGIYKQLVGCKGLPKHIEEILGLRPPAVKSGKRNLIGLRLETTDDVSEIDELEQLSSADSHQDLHALAEEGHLSFTA